MKILPSLDHFRSLGIEPNLLQLVSLSSISLWRMQHGMSSSPPLPPTTYAPFGLPDQKSVKQVLFDARHCLQESVIDSLLVSDAFVSTRMRQIKELHTDALSHFEQLQAACKNAIDKGLIPARRMSDAQEMSSHTAEALPEDSQKLLPPSP